MCNVGSMFSAIYFFKGKKEVIKEKKYEPRHEKISLKGFRPGPAQTNLYNHKRKLEISDLRRRGFVLSM